MWSRFPSSCCLGCIDFSATPKSIPWTRELLATPFGQLSASQTVDANWVGEPAMLYCWALNLVGPLETSAPVDQSKLPGLLSILKPEALEIVRSASLREGSEIQATCRQIVLTRSMLQEMRIGPPTSDIVRRMHLQRLAQVGLIATEHDIQRASEAVARMSPQEKSRAAGLYFVRDHAALWLFSDRHNYFAEQGDRD